MAWCSRDPLAPVTISGREFLVTVGGRDLIDPALLVTVSVTPPVVQQVHAWTVAATTVTGARVVLAQRDTHVLTEPYKDSAYERDLNGPPPGRPEWEACEQWAMDTQREVAEAIARTRP